MTTVPPQSEEKAPAEILREAMAAGDQQALAQQIITLAPRLVGDEIDVAYEAATKIDDEYQMAPVLASLGPRLHERLAFDALSRVSSFSDPRWAAAAMSGVVDGIPEERLKEARDVANTAVPDINLAILTSLLSVSAGAEEVNEVLVSVRESEDPETRVRAMIAVHPHVPNSLEEEIRGQATVAAMSIADIIRRVFTVIDLDPILPEDSRGGAIREGVSLLGLIADEIVRVDVLIELARRLPVEFLDELMETIAGINNLDQRRRAILYLEEIRERRSEEAFQDLLDEDQTAEEADSADAAEAESIVESVQETVEPVPDDVAIPEDIRSQAVKAPEPSSRPDGTPTGRVEPTPSAPVATYLHSDQWTDQDALGRELYAKAIAEFIYHKNTSPPLTVGILAPWGQGKTSLMRLIEKQLREKARGRTEATETADVQTPSADQDAPERTTLGKLEEWLKDAASPSVEPLESPIVWFNAWKYQSSEQIWAGLADSIITQLVAAIPNEEDRDRFWLALQAKRLDTEEISRDIRRLTLQRFIPKSLRWSPLVAGGLFALVGGAIAVPAWSELWGSVAGGGGFVGTVIAGLMNWRGWRESKTQVREQAVDGKFNSYLSRPDYESKQGYFHIVEQDVKRVFDLLVDEERPAVVFIDDLDRCSPGRVADVIEAVNVFAGGDFDNCYFVIGMDAQVAAAAMEVAHEKLTKKLQETTSRYGSLGWYFMDKFIQLPFVIPNLAPAQSQEYLAGLFRQSTESANEADVEETEEEKEEKDEQAEERVQRALSVDAGAIGDLARVIGSDLGRLRRNRPDSARRLSYDAIEKGSAVFTDDSPEIQASLLKYGEFLAGNPRTMKRFANLYRFYRLAQWSRELQGLTAATPSGLGRWIVVMLRWPQVIRWIQWESESVELATPESKARALEEYAATVRTFEEWEGSLRHDNLSYLLDLIDRPLYDFLRSRQDESESLARATEVGVW